MIRQSDYDKRCDDRTGAQDLPPTSPLERVGIDKSVRRCDAKTDIVAVLELLLAANPPSIDKRAARRLEIHHKVTAACVSNVRMTIRDARIRDSQSRPLRAAYP